MFPLSSLLLASMLALAGGSPNDPQATASAACGDWQTCRDLALEAREDGDAETFHDLAWRAVQTRGRRDPDLLFVLARAQSLSGRPHDALVTLQRLITEFHVAHDVTGDDDFRRVRALPGWADLQELLARANASAPGATPPPPPADAAREDAAPVTPARGAVPGTRAEEVARFAAPGFAPGGLAYDAVSRRFVIGNLPERKLTIVAQGTNRAATLSGDAAQLLGVRAIEIDRRNGDLWVVSHAREPGAGRSSEVHKLQLVSGRVLHVFVPPAELGPSRFVDVAIANGRGVLVLDAQTPRLLRPLPDGRSLAHVIDLPAGTPTSLAPADDGRTVYVAYADRIERVDLAARQSRPLAGSASPQLGGLTRLRWHKGTLIGVQDGGPDARVIRLRLGRTSPKIASVETLASVEPDGSPVTLDVLDDDLYYLVAGSPEAVISRIRLK